MNGSQHFSDYNLSQHPLFHPAVEKPYIHLSNVNILQQMDINLGLIPGHRSQCIAIGWLLFTMLEQVGFCIEKSAQKHT